MLRERSWRNLLCAQRCTDLILRSRTIEQYLHKYAATPPFEVRRTYAHVLVIPVYDEPIKPLQQLIQFCNSNDALCILVINAPDNAHASARERTLNLIPQLSAENACVLDHVTTPLPRRQGVGLARKIGSDLALSLIAEGSVKHPWIYQTDADARLPDQYFSAHTATSGAVVYAHRHISEDAELGSLAALYDQHMSLYVEGLRYAGSKYAYPTLGSTIAVHGQAYAEIRGFPKRNAAEDFYLLNKIAKVHNVAYREDVCVEVQARLSERVPFGTGPALRKIATSLSTGEPYLSYDPQVFVTLAEVLNALEQFAETTTTLNLPNMQLERMDTLGWQRVEDAFRTRYTRADTRYRAICDWFDAGKTLRFVNLARQHIPDIPLVQAQSLFKLLQKNGDKPSNM